MNGYFVLANRVGLKSNAAQNLQENYVRPLWATSGHFLMSAYAWITSALLPKADIGCVLSEVRRCGINVRFTPKSGHSQVSLECPLSAKSGLMQCSKQHCYSITSSARPSSDIGTVRPSAFAVFRLTSSSYFVGACTGRSAGFSPFRMRST